jgi:hypothetical protein
MSRTITVSLLTLVFILQCAALNPVMKDSGSKTVANRENRVHVAGQFWLNVTNNGFFGNPLKFDDPCTGQTAVSGNMPGGSNEQYLFAAGLMFGGYLENDSVDIKIPAKVFGDPLVTTAYEGWTGFSGTEDMPKELWPRDFYDDPEGTSKGKIIETSDTYGKTNCLMQDVYDPAATADEQFTTWYSDKYSNIYDTGIDFDEMLHKPLGIEVKQKTYAWNNPYAENLIIADFTIFNRNADEKDIYNFFAGMYTDLDVGIINGEWTYCHADDIGGFVHKWDKFIDPATGENRTVDLDLAWTADNDGRCYNGQEYYSATMEPPTGYPLNGATGVAALKVLKNPDPSMKYSYNLYVANSEDESWDWGPRWKDNLHSDWKYDLNMQQKGYDDYNQDGLHVDGIDGAYPLWGGRTEGRPLGDKGRYMVMSNGEADYSPLDIRQVYLGTYQDPDYLIGTGYDQAEKWRKWVVAGGTEFPDGTIQALNDHANGIDVKYILSFGPLGENTNINVAVDTNSDGIPESYITKEAWKFAYGDSIRFTFAFITGRNFNTSLDQDPNYADDSIVDMEDGLDASLYEQGWYDAFSSAAWAERLYDTPLYDTPVTKNGVTKGDGWCGEDVGKDGLFAQYGSNGVCWWFGEDYILPDEGECDNELTQFTSPKPDIYGWTAENEDKLLPFGHQTETAMYGEMIKYTKDDGIVPVNSMVRYGFGNGKVDQGDGVPDFKGPSAPPPPVFTVEKNTDEVILKWSSHFKNSEGEYIRTGPEHNTDRFSFLNDFEGYRIMISREGSGGSFLPVFTADKIDYSYQNIADPDDYFKIPVDQQRYNTLVANDSTVITSEGKIWQLVPFLNNNSMYEDHEISGQYKYEVEKDVSQIETAGEVRNYTFTLNKSMFEARDLIAVTAGDFGDPKYGVIPQFSDPVLNAVMLSNVVKAPSKDPQIVPNPVKADRLYTAEEWGNVIDPSYWKEDKLMAVFTNIPENCVIRIFTLAGDLVRTIGHNGSDADAEHKYKQVWYLNNENGDTVSSGMYLFSVQDADDKKDDYVGKFTVIR